MFSPQWPFGKGREGVEVPITFWPFDKGRERVEVPVTFWPFGMGREGVEVSVIFWPFGKGHERDGIPCGAHDSEGQHPCGLQ